MILADKIMSLRKKAGWSQEELAGQLKVSRQSVSKWEGAQSVPDMDKILQMSRLFGVTTDYLLKDELEEAEVLEVSAEDTPIRRVTMEEASEYLALSRKIAPKEGLATFLCVISPITLILLGGLSELPDAFVSEGAVIGIGMCALILLVALGVVLFQSCAAKVREYEFLEKEAFETEYGVSGMVKERKKEYKERYTRLNMIGTLLCICSVLPLFVAASLSAEDIACVVAVCLLLFLVGLGSMVFVYNGQYQEAMEKLLEEGDYTREGKARRGISGAVSVCYWLVVTAVFLIASFAPGNDLAWRQSWVIWPVAGVLYGAVVAVMKQIGKRK